MIPFIRKWIELEIMLSEVRLKYLSWVESKSRREGVELGVVRGKEVGFSRGSKKTEHDVRA